MDSLYASTHEEVCSIWQEVFPCRAWDCPHLNINGMATDPHPFRLVIFIHWPYIWSVISQWYLPLNFLYWWNKLNDEFNNLEFNGCRGRIWTYDLQIMSLTSYQTALLCDVKLVGEAGIEPAASRLSVVCANQLRHSPILVIPAGFEPTILAWKASDLTTCLRDHLVISFFISYYIYIIAYFLGFVHSFSCYNQKYF